MTKPAILTVDDDLAVLGAIERDLRQQYQSEYRILKAGSAAEGLAAGRALAREREAFGNPAPSAAERPLSAHDARVRKENA